MKNLILGISLILSAFAFNAQAATNVMAKATVKEDVTSEQALINLFAQEAAKPKSKLGKYLAALKATPENEGYTIDDTIIDSDLVRLDSGSSAGSFEVNYLILIRGGYKSNTFQVGYLKARAFGSIESDFTTTVTIDGPAKVTIE